MLRRLFGELLHNRLQRGVRSLARLARLEPEVHDIDRHRVLVQIERQVNVGTVPLEARRCDPRDHVIFVFELQRLPQHSWIGIEVPLPELITKHRNGLRALSFHGVARHQSRSTPRRYTKKVEAIGCKEDGIHIFGQVVPGQSQRPVIHRHQAVDCRRLPQLLDLRAAQADPSTVAGVVPDPQPHDAVSLREGKRMDQRGVDHAEDRRRRSNPKRKRDHSRQAESRAVHQLPQRIAEILKHTLHRSLLYLRYLQPIIACLEEFQKRISSA
jgi:hypothetical protein